MKWVQPARLLLVRRLRPLDSDDAHARGVLLGALELQVPAGQQSFDLVDGLLTDVADVPEIGLGLIGEITDGVDALTIQAVEGPYADFVLLTEVCQLLVEVSLYGRDVFDVDELRSWADGRSSRVAKRSLVPSFPAGVRTSDEAFAVAC